MKIGLWSSNNDDHQGDERTSPDDDAAALSTIRASSSPSSCSHFCDCQYHHNHRRWLMSLSDKQLMDELDEGLLESLFFRFQIKSVEEQLRNQPKELREARDVLAALEENIRATRREIKRRDVLLEIMLHATRDHQILVRHIQS